MLEFYWTCLIIGAVITIITIIFGDIVDGFFDGLFSFLSGESLGFIQPLTLVGGITIFGGTGIMLTKYTPFGSWNVAIISLLTALILSVLLHFFYVKPMKNMENSLGYSMKEHVGKLAEVITSIPAAGCGEVIIKAGISNTNQIASSYEGDEIEAGAKVVVVEVKDSILYVVRFDKK